MKRFSMSAPIVARLIVARLIVAPVIVAALLAFALPAHAKAHHKRTRVAGPDKAYLQKIWDGWATLKPASVAQFYAPGPDTFFDIAPLKYTSWEDYQSGSTKVLADFKGAKFSINDDAQLHPAGRYEWGSATINYELTHQDGKVDKGNFRWTVVFEDQGGKWLIVHEHVSVPMQ